MKWPTLLFLMTLAACASFTESPTRSPDSTDVKEEPRALDYHRYYPADFR